MMEKDKGINVFDDIDALLEVSDVTLTVTGTSMWPFFKENKTKVKLAKITEIKKGKSYLFEFEGRHVIHRLVKIKGEGLIFRGDGNVKRETVKKESLIAELVSYKNKKKEIFVTSKKYRFKVFIYRLLPRRIIIKLFKRIK